MERKSLKESGVGFCFCLHRIVCIYLSTLLHRFGTTWHRCASRPWCSQLDWGREDDSSCHWLHTFFKKNYSSGHPVYSIASLGTVYRVTLTNGNHWHYNGRQDLLVTMNHALSVVTCLLARPIPCENRAFWEVKWFAGPGKSSMRFASSEIIVSLFDGYHALSQVIERIWHISGSS